MPNPSELVRTSIEDIRDELESLREECEQNPTGSLIAQIEQLETQIKELQSAD